MIVLGGFFCRDFLKFPQPTFDIRHTQIILAAATANYWQKVKKASKSHILSVTNGEGGMMWGGVVVSGGRGFNFKRRLGFFHAPWDFLRSDSGVNIQSMPSTKCTYKDLDLSLGWLAVLFQRGFRSNPEKSVFFKSVFFLLPSPPLLTATGLYNFI